MNAAEKWLKEGLDDAFPESDEQKREREAGEVFGALIAEAVKPTFIEDTEDEGEDETGTLPPAALSLAASAEEIAVRSGLSA